jgi:hypothetical protein
MTPEDDKITISSEFDSGNLARCKQLDSAKNTFYMYMSQDSEPYTDKGHYRTWFYFSVSGVPANTTLTFVMRNMNNQGALY